MSVRAVETVRGIETTIAVDKADNDTFVVIGCATEINWTSDKAMLEANCYAGKEMLPSGDDAVKSMTINGVVKEYSTANSAANVSSYELELWHNEGTLKKFKYARPNVDDVVRGFEGFITQYSEAGTANGLQTYTATITPRKKGTLTQATA